MPGHLQLNAGVRRASGQEGYATVRVHVCVTRRLRRYFAVNDTHGVETMALLFGGAAPGGSASTRATYIVTDIVIMEHTVTKTSCAFTDQGSRQLSKYLKSAPSKVLVGWAHSHHQVKLIPQGRVPSQPDVNTQYTLQRQFAPTANLMLIMNEVGVSCWTLPASSMQLIGQQKGDSSKVAQDPGDLVDSATFVDFISEGVGTVEVHELGASLRDGDAASSRAGTFSVCCTRCSHPLALVDRFCGVCGLASSIADDGAECCPHCSKPVDRGDLFCSGCGARCQAAEQCSACSKPLVAGDKFCGGCGTTTCHELAAIAIVDSARPASASGLQAQMAELCQQRNSLADVESARPALVHGLQSQLAELSRLSNNRAG